jgi:hypothetical protein
MGARGMDCFAFGRNDGIGAFMSHHPRELE